MNKLKRWIMAHKNAHRNAGAIERLKKDISQLSIDLEAYIRFNLRDEPRQAAKLLDRLEGILTGTPGTHYDDLIKFLDQKYQKENKNDRS